MPKSFFRILASKCKLSNENIPAAILPAMIAGSIFFICIAPCFHRKMETAPAAVMKNIKLIRRASGPGIFSASVSHKISNEPPPTPKPARQPRITPISSETGKEPNIDIEHLPRESIRQGFGVAISPGSFLQCIRPVFRHRYRHANRVVPMRWGFPGKMR